jgi:hypothetical protein
MHPHDRWAADVLQLDGEETVGKVGVMGESRGGQKRSEKWRERAGVGRGQGAGKGAVLTALRPSLVGPLSLAHHLPSLSCLSLCSPQLQVNQLQHLLLAELLLMGPLLMAGGSLLDLLGQGQAPRQPGGRPSQRSPAHEGATTAAAATTSLAGVTAAGTDDFEASSAAAAAAAAVSLEPGMRARARQLLPSFLWWCLRATALHQHVLSGRSHSLLKRVALLMKELLQWAGPLSTPSTTDPTTSTTSTSTSGPGTGTAGAGESMETLEGLPALRGALLLEMALLQYSYGYIDQAQRFLEAAGEVMGLHTELGGAMGKRTVHQVGGGWRGGGGRWECDAGKTKAGRVVILN